MSRCIKSASIRRRKPRQVAYLVQGENVGMSQMSLNLDFSTQLLLAIGFLQLGLEQHLGKGQCSGGEWMRESMRLSRAKRV